MERADSGIWEGREGERHYVASKLMCWVALDRGVRLAARLGERAAPQRWAVVRDEVRRAILEQGWRDDIGAFTGAFGSEHLDASVLLMPLFHFLPAGDERMLKTIAAVEGQLGAQGLLQRWTEAEDGAFLLASYWLVECLARAGQIERAREVFESVGRHANDVGLLAEEIDTSSGALLGNFPQALSHVGVINGAAAIASAERARARGRAAEELEARR